MANLTFNAIDVETANRTRASICQIGIAQVQVGKIERAASFLINPEEPFESFQVSLHGINEEAVSEAETMLSVHPKLCRLIEKAPLASHSLFDKQALEKSASKYGLTMPQIKWLDTGRVARAAWPDRYDGSNWGLKKIAADLGIEFLHHDAAEDARAAAEILLHACRHTGLDVDDWLEKAGYERSTAAQTKVQQVQQTNHESKISGGTPRQSALPPWNNTLAKILALEEEKEFTNRSVTGGIDRFIQKHARAIIEELGNSGIHRIILRIPYRGLTQDKRPWWVEQWRAVMSRMQQVSSPKPPNQCSPTPIEHENEPPRPASCAVRRRPCCCSRVGRECGRGCSVCFRAS